MMKILYDPIRLSLYYSSTDLSCAYLYLFFFDTCTHKFVCRSCGRCVRRMYFVRSGMYVYSYVQFSERMCISFLYILARIYIGI